MTSFYRFTCIALLTGWITTGWAQTGRYDLRLGLQAINCSDRKVQVQLQIRASDAGSAFRLIDATLRLSFLRSELANPVLLEETNFSSAAPAGDAAYDAQVFATQVGPTKGAVGLTIAGLNTPAALRQVGTDWITIAVLGFDVVNPLGCSSLTFNTSDDFPPSGVREAYAAGSTYAYRGAVSSGVYSNLSACLSRPFSCVVVSCQRIP